MEHRLQVEAESAYRAGGQGIEGGREGGGALTKRSSFHLNHHSWMLPFSSKNLDMGHTEKMLSKNSWGEREGEGGMSRREHGGRVTVRHLKISEILCHHEELQDFQSS